MSRGDVAALRKIIGPETILVHHDGRRESGASYLARLEASGSPFSGWTMTDETVVSIGDVQIVSGRLNATVVRDGQRSRAESTILRTWARASGDWVLVSITSSGH